MIALTLSSRSSASCREAAPPAADRARLGHRSPVRRKTLRGLLRRRRGSPVSERTAAPRCYAFPPLGYPNNYIWEDYLAANPNVDGTSHDGGSNIAFFDGHAKWEKAESIIASY